jgi:uncharacterized protein YlbG (UPF0298 family)
MMHHWLSGDPRFGRLTYFGRNKKYALLYEALGRLMGRHKMTFVQRASAMKFVTS